MNQSTPLVMTPEKKEQLIAAGWRVGSAEEFLNLSPTESLYIDLKMKLNQQLRQQCKAQQIT